MGTISNENRGTSRFFVTYTGVKLPFRLVKELQGGEVENRNTYFQGYFDAQERLCRFEKIVYGEIEPRHSYVYHDNGKLKKAEITDIGGDVTVLEFNADCKPG